VVVEINLQEREPVRSPYNHSAEKQETRQFATISKKDWSMCRATPPSPPRTLGGGVKGYLTQRKNSTSHSAYNINGTGQRSYQRQCGEWSLLILSGKKDPQPFGKTRRMESEKSLVLTRRKTSINMARHQTWRGGSWVVADLQAEKCEKRETSPGCGTEAAKFRTVSWKNGKRRKTDGPAMARS